MIVYLNDQLKKLYNVTDKDYVDWCTKRKKPKTSKSSVKAFIERLRTGRLVKDSYGNLIVKKPRKAKARR